MFSDLSPTNRHPCSSCTPCAHCNSWLLSATSSRGTCFMIYPRAAWHLEGLSLLSCLVSHCCFSTLPGRKTTAANGESPTFLHGKLWRIQWTRGSMVMCLNLSIHASDVSLFPFGQLAWLVEIPSALEVIELIPANGIMEACERNAWRRRRLTSIVWRAHRHLLHQHQRLQTLATRLPMSQTCWEWIHHPRSYP